MLEIIDGMPDSVIAVRGVGKVSGDDYREVLDPAIERATSHGRKVRFYLELGDGFEGYEPSAMLADASVGMGHLTSFERVAVVTDTDWIRHAIHLLGPLIPADVRVFSIAEVDTARAWVTS